MHGGRWIGPVVFVGFPRVGSPGFTQHLASVWAISHDKSCDAQLAQALRGVGKRYPQWGYLVRRIFSARARLAGKPQADSYSVALSQPSR